MSARTAILKAVTKALPRGKRNAAAVAAEASLLIAQPQVVRSELPPGNLTECFVRRVAKSKVATTVHRIASIDKLPEAVARHLAERRLPSRIALQPTGSLMALDWAAAGLLSDGVIGDGAAVGLAPYGIAETGSLVFHSAPDAPVLFNFLPEVHILAVHASSILPYLEDYAAAARRDGDQAPRNVCIISGASGTTDIEGNLVLGAHGPRELHVVVIGDAGT
jgi:L-lactate dehydrogenase complex protein LldG